MWGNPGPVADPVEPYDIANKRYVDGSGGGGGKTPYRLAAIYPSESPTGAPGEVFAAWTGTVPRADQPTTDFLAELSPIPVGFSFEAKLLRAVIVNQGFLGVGRLDIQWFKANVRSSILGTITLIPPSSTTREMDVQTPSINQQLKNITNADVFNVNMINVNATKITATIMVECWGFLTHNL